jgi:hypothetical protein
VSASPRSDAALQSEVRKLASMVTTARRLVCGGTMVDLTALGDKVEDVCRAVQALPAADGRGLLPNIEALVRELDGLAEDLRIQNEAMCRRERP